MEEEEKGTPFDDELRDLLKSKEYSRAEKNRRQVVLVGSQVGYRRRLSDESKDLYDLQEMAAAAKAVISEVKEILYEGQIKFRVPSFAWLENTLSRLGERRVL